MKYLVTILVDDDADNLLDSRTLKEVVEGELSDYNEEYEIRANSKGFSYDVIVTEHVTFDNKNVSTALQRIADRNKYQTR